MIGLFWGMLSPVGKIGVVTLVVFGPGLIWLAGYWVGITIERRRPWAWIRNFEAAPGFPIDGPWKKTWDEWNANADSGADRTGEGSEQEESVPDLA